MCDFPRDGWEPRYIFPFDGSVAHRWENVGSSFTNKSCSERKLIWHQASGFFSITPSRIVVAHKTEAYFLMTLRDVFLAEKLKRFSDRGKAFLFVSFDVAEINFQVNGSATSRSLERSISRLLKWGSGIKWLRRLFIQAFIYFNLRVTLFPSESSIHKLKLELSFQIKFLMCIALVSTCQRTIYAFPEKGDEIDTLEDNNGLLFEEEVKGEAVFSSDFARVAMSPSFAEVTGHHQSPVRAKREGFVDLGSIPEMMRGMVRGFSRGISSMMGHSQVIAHQ